MILSNRNKRSESVRTIEELSQEFVPHMHTFKRYFQNFLLKINQQLVEMLPTAYTFDNHINVSFWLASHSFKVRVQTILQFSIDLRQCFGGHKVPKLATLASLLCTWSIPESKTQTGFIRATIHWQNTFSLKTNVNGPQTRMGYLCFVTKLPMHLKAVLEFSFLPFVCLLRPPLRIHS